MRSLLRKVFSPPPIPSVIIIAAGGAMVIAALLVKTLYNTAFAYIAYLASAYALAVAIASIPKIVGAISRRVMDSKLVTELRRNPMIALVMDDAEIRTRLTAIMSMLMDSVYIVIKLIAGIMFKSLWFWTMAVYYTCLTVMRGLLVLPIRRFKSLDKLSEQYRRYELCGFMLCIMNIALAVIVVMTVNQKHSPFYPGFVIYIMAGYSLYAVISAIVNIAKYSKNASPLFSGAKAISLTAALVSLYSLQTAMIIRFGMNDENFYLVMSAITGSVVCAAAMIMSLVMIAKGSRALKKLEKMRS